MGKLDCFIHTGRDLALVLYSLKISLCWALNCHNSELLGRFSSNVSQVWFGWVRLGRVKHEREYPFLKYQGNCVAFRLAVGPLFQEYLLQGSCKSNAGLYAHGYSYECHHFVQALLSRSPWLDCLRLSSNRERKEGIV